MANLKEIRIRIASVQSTQKITGAMKMVSAAKLRRAQTAIINLRPYSNKLNEILKNLSSSADEMENMPLFQQRKEANIAIVVISSNRGLCGSFNTNVFKKVEHILQTEYEPQAANGNVQLYCIGKKAKEQLIKNHEITWFNETLLDTSAFDEIADLGEQLMQDFINKKIDSVRIVYNKFINPATQELVSEDFLPIQNINKESESTKTYVYIFEPS